MIRTIQKHKKLILALIILFGLAIRAWLITCDPFLYSWDERFHANVAKNMLLDPFHPTLRINPIKYFDYTQWCCNATWLHKPPLFLWKMAFAIKIFGANEWAIRIPSWLMSAGIIFTTFKIGALLDSSKTGLLAALAMCLSRYQIERSIGNLSTDHNDAAFLFYMTIGLYFLLKYILANHKKSLIIFAIATGLAALVKGPQAMTLFLLFGLFKLYEFQKTRSLKFKDIAGATLIYLMISMPWTLFTSWRFPKESAFERSYNLRHIWEVAENHGGNWMWHFDYFDNLYGPYNFIFFAIGAFAFVKIKSQKNINRILLAFIGIIYAFYSFVVQTKMPGYVFLVCPIIYIIMALGLKQIFLFLKRELKKRSAPALLRSAFFSLILVLFLWNNLRPHEMYQFHVHDKTSKYYSWDGRKSKKQNTKVYKMLDDILPKDCVVFNTPPYEGVEVMFFSGRNAYQYLEEELYHQLKNEGKCIAYFKYVENQPLLPWVVDDDEIIWIEEALAR